MAQVEAFCKKLLMPSRIILRLQTVIEEAVVQKILAVSTDTIRWKIYVRGAEEDHHPRISIKYDGAVQNPLTGEDLSMRIIQNLAEKIEHKTVSDDVYTNEIIIYI